MNTDAKVLTPKDRGYPDSLGAAFGELALPDIWYLGNVGIIDTKAVGFCGSRGASEYGLQIAADCASQLSAGGVTVVSGYAPGVDMASHEAALAGGGTNDCHSSGRDRPFSHKKKHRIVLGLAAHTCPKSVPEECHMAA
jgi:predicted Rossmann fold nucleotide-binding protein DprA/Smf involved in DNA uptake